MRKEDWHSYLEMDNIGGSGVYIQKGRDKINRELLGEFSYAEMTNNRDMVDDLLHEAFLIVESRNSEGF